MDPATNPSPASVPANFTVRELKKRAAMEHVQTVALDLFDARGYPEVTVEDVAAAAGVSPNTVYRHFGTKDRLVLHDDFDAQMFVLLMAYFPERRLVGAARAVVDRLEPVIEAGGYAVQRRVRYMFDEPTVYAGLMGEIREINAYLAPQLVEATARTEHPVDLVTATVATDLLIAALLTGVRLWREAGFAPSLRHHLEPCFDMLGSVPF
ncbi:MAG: TetR/AcrR family transcriptional regulator [Micrococcales bacterium]|nr:TetR/AcrR family transcriptional regulator [Micrococcales bacterium]